MIGQLITRADQLTGVGMVVSNDGTKTTILGTAGDYIRIGDAGTTNHSLNSEDDLMVTGDHEVKGNMFVDGSIDTSTLIVVPTRGIENRVNNQASISIGIGVTTPDSTDHEIKLEVESTTIFGARATGDGSGGITDQKSIFYQPTTESFFSEFMSGTQSIGGFKLVKVVYDKDSALFDAAGTTDNVELLAATSGRQIIAAKIVLETQFALNGDRTDLIVEMGEDGADIDDIIDNTGNLETDSAGTEYKTRGVLWDTAAETFIFNRVIDLTATLSGGSSGDLASMSAGQIAVYLLTLDW